MVAATLSLAIGGCSSDDNLAPASTNIAVTATDTDFEAFGGEGTIYIDTDATTIEATTDAAWLTITEAYSASKDGKAWVSFVVEENRSDVVRTATVTICTGARECRTTITQQSAVMMISDVTTEFAAMGGEGQMTVETSATGLEVTSDSEWLTIGAIEGTTVNYTAAVNASAKERTAVVTLTLGTVNRVVNIKQAGATLTVVDSKLDFENGGGKGEVLLETTFPEVSAEVNADWVTIDIASPQKVTYTVAPNTATDSRTATLKILAGEISQTLTISQKCASLTVVEAPAEFYGVGGNGRITIDCDAPTVTATADVDWITIVQANPEAVYFTVGLTPLASSREGTITIKANDLTQTVPIKQAAASLDIIPNVTTYTADAATGDFGVTIPTSALSVSSDADWVTFGEPTESGFTYSLAANPTGADRIATITVTLSNEVSKTFTLTQKFHNYDYFVDTTWTMHYLSSSDEAKTVDVTIAAHTDATKATEGYYIMKVVGKDYPITVKYDNGNLAVTLSQDLGKWDNTSGENGQLWCSMTSKGTNGYNGNLTNPDDGNWRLGFNMIFNGDKDNPELTFELNENSKARNISGNMNPPLSGFIFFWSRTSDNKAYNWGGYKGISKFVKK